MDTKYQFSVRLLIIVVSVCCLLLLTSITFGILVALYLGVSLSVIGAIYGYCTNRRTMHLIGVVMFATQTPLLILISAVVFIGIWEPSYVPWRPSYTPTAFEEMARIVRQPTHQGGVKSRPHWLFSHESSWMIPCTAHELEIIGKKYDLVAVENADAQKAFWTHVQEFSNPSLAHDESTRYWSTRSFPLNGMNGPDGDNLFVAYVEEQSLLIVWNKFIF